jgi:hypothetical protein
MDSIRTKIDRVRRQTTNRDILDICDSLMRHLNAGRAAIDATRAEPMTRAEIQKNYRARKKAKSK